MKLPLETADGLGAVIRAARKAQGMRQDDAAGAMGVSENFLGKVERGDGSVRWEKLFRVLRELGIRVELDVPDEVAARLEAATGNGSRHE